MTLDLAIARLVEESTAAEAERLQSALQAMGGHDSSTLHRLCASVPGAAGRSLATALDAAWASSPGTIGPSLSLGLGAAIAARDRIRSASQITLVVTGPDVTGVPVRQTRAVALELIGKASRSIILSTFSAGRVDDLVDALGAAYTRGVTIRLVLETTSGSGGFLSKDAGDAFASLRGRASIYHWPIEHRTLPDGHVAGAYTPHALLHAKTLVVDASAAFITSANVSETAMERSIEAGVIVRGGDVPRQLAAYWEGLIARGELKAR